jgi:hypothetical protein
LCFANNALKVVFAGNLEKPFPELLEMVAIEQSVRLLNQEPQSTFPLDERCVMEVLTVAPQQVEGTKTSLSAMEEKVIELRVTVLSRETFSESSTAECPFNSSAIAALREPKDLNSFPFRETRRQ